MLLTLNISNYEISLSIKYQKFTPSGAKDRDKKTWVCGKNSIFLQDDSVRGLKDDRTEIIQSSSWHPTAWYFACQLINGTSSVNACVPLAKIAMSDSQRYS